MKMLRRKQGAPHAGRVVEVSYCFYYIRTLPQPTAISPSTHISLVDIIYLLHCAGYCSFTVAKC